MHAAKRKSPKWKSRKRPELRRSKSTRYTGRFAFKGKMRLVQDITMMSCNLAATYAAIARPEGTDLQDNFRRLAREARFLQALPRYARFSRVSRAIFGYSRSLLFALDRLDDVVFPAVGLDAYGACSVNEVSDGVIVEVKQDYRRVGRLYWTIHVRKVSKRGRWPIVTYLRWSVNRTGICRGEKNSLIPQLESFVARLEGSSALVPSDWKGPRRVNGRYLFERSAT